MSGVCAETISSGKAFQCLNIYEISGTNGVKSWTELEMVVDGEGRLLERCMILFLDFEAKFQLLRASSNRVRQWL